jgi:hypothetical protein
MKRSLLITFVAICTASVAFAAPGSIGIFADLGAASCTLTNDGPTGPLVESLVYVVHTGSDGTTGCSFQALVPGCASLIAIVDVPQVPVYLGAQPAPAIPSQVGASAGYGNCFQGVKPVTQIFVSSLAPAVGCCLWTVTANPALGFTTPTSTDCSTPIQEEGAAGGSAFITATPGPGCSCETPTAESTWGGVKELFRQGI